MDTCKDALEKIKKQQNYSNCINRVFMQGATGPQGPQGDIGPTGPIPNILVGNVTTGPPGTGASVTITKI